MAKTKRGLGERDGSDKRDLDQLNRERVSLRAEVQEGEEQRASYDRDKTVWCSVCSDWDTLRRRSQRGVRYPEAT